MIFNPLDGRLWVAIGNAVGQFDNTAFFDEYRTLEDGLDSWRR